ncbi:hypothetical protein FCL53_17860 [Elizabethkingia meningoseptica]|uniref:hypothetical protein n=1 Tax=Elizabethkingia meningoseptica TaxID=238 RepID=UPI0013665E14|nr:hypothetical protein [Elizabethkingia meningoseptica]MVW93832.1 hypothetical protein [Elizabethkingia meningoseptica]
MLRNKILLIASHLNHYELSMDILLRHKYMANGELMIFERLKFRNLIKSKLFGESILPDEAFIFSDDDMSDLIIHDHNNLDWIEVYFQNYFQYPASNFEKFNSALKTLDNMGNFQSLMLLREVFEMYFQNKSNIRNTIRYVNKNPKVKKYLENNLPLYRVRQLIHILNEIIEKIQ